MAETRFIRNKYSITNILLRIYRYIKISYAFLSNLIENPHYHCEITKDLFRIFLKKREREKKLANQRKNFKKKEKKSLKKSFHEQYNSSHVTPGR